LEQGWGFRALVTTLRDARPRPQIPTATVWLAAFALFVLRMPSFHALEQDFRRPRRWVAGLGGRPPSAETLGRGLARLSLPEVRHLVAVVHHRAWRRKTIHGWPGDPYRVVAVDGHELWASQARCCAQCLRREVVVRGERRVEYYHRVVVAQWVGVTPPGILDVERIHPQEGEVVAARRLVARLLRTYGRLVDVITADALYLEAPFIRQVLAAGKHVVVVLKQEARELYQDAERLRALVAPQVSMAGPRTTRLWDLPALASFPTLGQAVRVVWAEESTTRRRRVGGQWQTRVETQRWIWVTDLPGGGVPASTIQRWGHARWDLETRGLGELTTLSGTWATASFMTSSPSKPCGSRWLWPFSPRICSTRASSSRWPGATSPAWPSRRACGTT
jgi:hypothetical protein